MFRTISRLFLPNRLDWMCRKAKRRNARHILLAWNRGLGDIPLGLYAIVYRIGEWIPDAEITFLIRANLQEGFSLLPGIRTIIAPDWRRNEPYCVRTTLQLLKIDPRAYDLIIDWPSPSEWVAWQRGRLTPRLEWNPANDCLSSRFALSLDKTYIGVQLAAETQYGLWRNWPESCWKELLQKLQKHPQIRLIAFGFGSEPQIFSESMIDLRGKTSLFEMLSIIKNHCSYLILPDSGILSMVYYLNVNFPIHVVSLWADPNHGVLKQNVKSPNQQLIHTPIIGDHHNLSSVSADQVIQKLGLPHA